MDANAFKKFVLPWVTMGLTVLGKYIVPPIAALSGIQAAEANNWWVGTVTVLAGIIVGGITSWLTKKKIIQTAAAATDAKIKAYDKAPEGTAASVVVSYDTPSVIKPPEAKP